MTRIPAPPTEPVRAAMTSTPMTSVVDGREHEVGDTDLLAGRLAGTYRTLCGEVIWPTPMTLPAGRPCRVCALEADPGPEIRWETDPQRARRLTATWLRGVRLRTTRNQTTVRPRDLSPAGATDVAA